VLSKLNAVADKYHELEALLSDPSVMADMEKWQRYTREHAALTPIIEAYTSYQRALATIDEDKEMLAEADAEMKEMLTEEIAEAEAERDRLAEQLPILLLPRDPNDDKNVIVEIRGGVGGEEAALFAASLFRMYARYAERQGWRTEILSSNPTEIGGFKEVSFLVNGAGAYSRLKYESGTHRVQRIPVTESGGRIHTSAVTVAVLPEAEEVEVTVDPNDLRIDTYCASGAGGQYVNRTETAIRITHIPTGIVVQCQDEKSQLKNREKAMSVPAPRPYAGAQRGGGGVVPADRRSQVGSGDRSERIRTYNFPQGRVTDHRIGLTIYKIDAVLDGELDEILAGLITADQAERLKQVN